MKMMNRVCPVCGKVSKTRSECCSNKCAGALRIVFHKLVCKYCGVEFESKFKSTVYCSRECQMIGQFAECEELKIKKLDFDPEWEYIELMVFATITSSYNTCKNALKKKRKTDYREYPCGVPYIGKRYSGKVDNERIKDCWEFMFGLDDGYIDEYAEVLRAHRAIREYRRLLLDGYKGAVIPEANMSAVVNLKTRWDLKMEAEDGREEFRRVCEQFESGGGEGWR